MNKMRGKLLNLCGTCLGKLVGFDTYQKETVGKLSMAGLQCHVIKNKNLKVVL